MLSLKWCSSITSIFKNISKLNLVFIFRDFLQLPPVKCNYFAFETNAWKRCINKTIVLGKVFRQKNFGFVSLLNRLRVGSVTSSDIEVLHHCHRTVFPDDGIKATCLFPLRSTCDRVNQSEVFDCDKILLFYFIYYVKLLTVFSFKFKVF